MNSFGPQSYTTAVKRLAPNHSKFKKESIALVTFIIYEINNEFVNTCLKNNVSAKDITAKHVKDSIKNSIPGELRKYAFEAGGRTVMEYNTGLLEYKGTNIQKEKRIGLDTRILRKCLEQITQVINSDLRLSKDCSVLLNIIQKMTMQVAEKAVETIGDKSEMSLDDMRNAVHNLLGEEMFQHSVGHAESNLEWYRADDLDFTIKPIITEVEERISDDENIFLGKCVQKALKSKYSTATISKEIIQSFEKILKDLNNRIFEETKIVFQRGIDNVPNDSISEEHVAQAFRTLLPEPLFQLGLCNAEDNLLKYRLGILKYTYDRKKEDGLTKEEERADTSIVPDFRKGVKHLLNTTCPFSRGFLPYMNDVLNDIGSTIAGRSSQSAKNNDNVLKEKDIIAAVNDLLPIQLSQHAIARIAQIHFELGHPCIQLPGHVSSCITQLAEVKNEENHKQSTPGTLPIIPKSLLDETKISEQVFSPRSELHPPPISHSDSFANDNQMPPNNDLDTNEENTVNGKYPGPRGSKSVEKNSEMPDQEELMAPRASRSAGENSGMSSSEFDISKKSGVSNEPQLMKSNSNTLSTSGHSEPMEQSEYETIKGTNSEDKSEQVGTKTSNSEVRITTSNDNQMPPKNGSDTNGENTVNGKFPGPRVSNSVEKKFEMPDQKELMAPHALNSTGENSGMSSSEIDNLEKSGVSNESQLTKSNSNTLSTAGYSEPMEQSEYETIKRANLEDKSEQFGTKTSNSEVRKTTSAILSLMESYCAAEYKDYLLDIPRKIYWLDVKPYKN